MRSLKLTGNFIKLTIYRFFNRVISKKNKLVSDQISELESLKIKLRILDYNILKFESKYSMFFLIDEERKKTEVREKETENLTALKEIGFHALASQWAQLNRK